MRVAPDPKRPTNDPSTRIGGTFMKASHIEERMPAGSGALFLEIDNRPVSRDAAEAAEHGPRPGRYGLDVPVHIGSDPFVVTIPEWTEDYAGIRQDFGADLDVWPGLTLAVWIDAQTGYVRFCTARAAAEAGLMAPAPAAPPAPAQTTIAEHTHFGAPQANGGIKWSPVTPAPLSPPMPPRAAPKPTPTHSACRECGADANTYLDSVPYCARHMDLARVKAEAKREALAEARREARAELETAEAARRQAEASEAGRHLPVAPPAPVRGVAPPKAGAALPAKTAARKGGR